MTRLPLARSLAQTNKQQTGRHRHRQTSDTHTNASQARVILRYCTTCPAEIEPLIRDDDLTINGNVKFAPPHCSCRASVANSDRRGVERFASTTRASRELVRLASSCSKLDMALRIGSHRPKPVSVLRACRSPTSQPSLAPSPRKLRSSRWVRWHLHN